MEIKGCTINFPSENLPLPLTLKGGQIFSSSPFRVGVKTAENLWLGKFVVHPN